MLIDSSTDRPVVKVEWWGDQREGKTGCNLTQVVKLTLRDTIGANQMVRELLHLMLFLAGNRMNTFDNF